MIQRALMHRLFETTPPLGAVPAVAFALGMLVGTAAAHSVDAGAELLPWSRAAVPIAPVLDRPGLPGADPSPDLVNAQLPSAVTDRR